LKEKSGRSWLGRILDFINPLRDPSLTVAAVLTFIEEVGPHNAWYIIIVVALVNWLAVRGVVWLVVNFTFAAVFISRRIWWSIKHPQLAWRILDAVGHEEIVIGGNSGLSESIMLQDGTTIMSPLLGANGIHVIGELPAGTELPMLGMPSGQLPAEGYQPYNNNAGFFPGTADFSPNGFAGQSSMNYQPAGNNTFNNDFVSAQSTDGLQQNFAQRPSAEEERLREQNAALNRLLEDWMQFTEEKWRAISDSQLGWKPLRGRWGNWDDIFSDAYAAKTSDPMAEAAQRAGEATSRRFETAKDKGSAASAVACFMRDMMTLRRSMDMVQSGDQSAQEPIASSHINSNKRFGNPSGSLFNGASGGSSPKSSLIRKPAQIFVDADAKK
jgi:hypothetical protein